ncbi:MAG: phosphatidylglycerol lysyltransferase domain-containing protein [Desulfobacterota bacterium]|nr:phosphatidylglycerol lysyltransferase domain-containing protein [Thermodesulfobacteriota bacterium]
MPFFPDFKEVTIHDRDELLGILHAYQPETSEFTFTNLFIWQPYYATRWSLYRDWLIIVCTDHAGSPYCLQPIGPPHRDRVVRMLLSWLREELHAECPRIERADRRLVKELGDLSAWCVSPQREHFDYVYKTDALISLSGRKYHAKKNHINKFMAAYAFTYTPLNQSLIQSCLALQDLWCRCHRCVEDMSLMGEWEAIKKLLEHVALLQVQGGAILIDGKVEAFTIGEQLNHSTAVVHIEKANPNIPGLYSVINQQFCKNAWKDVLYINREQDLGDDGLRQAKLSYHPDHLVEKYRIEAAVR